MKLYLLLIILMISHMPTPTFSQDKDIENVLLDVYKSDQNFRKKIMESLRNNSIDSIVYYNDLIKKSDIKNQEVVFNILNNQGWPRGLSEKANNAIFLVIDHAELQYQKKYLDLIKYQSENDSIDKDSYPTILDRVLMREGKRQIYGTQTKLNMAVGKDSTKVLYIWPIDNVQLVDSLRKTIGLPPLSVYIKILKMQLDCDVIYDDNIEPSELAKI